MQKRKMKARKNNTISSAMSSAMSGSDSRDWRSRPKRQTTGQSGNETKVESSFSFSEFSFKRSCWRKCQARARRVRANKISKQTGTNSHSNSQRTKLRTEFAREPREQRSTAKPTLNPFFYSRLDRMSIPQESHQLSRPSGWIQAMKEAVG